MAGFTDQAFRKLCKRCSGESLGLVCTEMVSAKAITYNNAKTADLLKIDADERPAAVQLFGNDPQVMAEASRRIADMDFDILDINMGCPVKKITGNGEGSALMKDPALIEKIVLAVSRAVPEKPVTVKLRTGVDENHINAVECALAAEAGGAAAVVVHGRTAKQMYSGEIDIDVIRDVARALKIPVIGNGNVTDGESALRMLEYTGCDGVMIARAARGNPWLFADIAQYLTTGETGPQRDADEVRDAVLWFIDTETEKKGEYLAVRELRSSLAFFLKGIPGSARMRERINTTSDIGELKAMIVDIFT